jgi:hypothetical protein
MQIEVKGSMEEFNVLLDLMDTALKAKGLEKAVPAAFWQQKIRASFEEAQKPKVEEPKKEEATNVVTLKETDDKKE